MSPKIYANQPAPRVKAAKRVHDGEICPRCGRANARVLGRSESVPVVYLRCDDCGRTSVAPV